MKQRPFANPYLRAGGGGFVENSSHSDDEYDPRGRAFSKDRNGRRAMQNSAAKAQVGRSRPTNNQLLYKAYFRWAHYPFKIKNNGVVLPTETDACPSVTAAFLQVLHTLHAAEISRVGPRRNVLQILSTNTKKTKVVELSTGTHRVPDELKKHYLSDGEAGQYSTNLDRNRYGNDDQYLFTVVRYDLEFLGLCPCMVDVEIIDAKNDNQSIFVSAGPEACACHKQEGGWAAADSTPYTTMQHMQRHQPHGGSGKPLGPGAVQDSPKRSASAFDALLMAATGGTDGAAAGAEPAGEPPVTSKFGADVSGPAAAPAPAPALAATPAAAPAAVPAAAAAAAPAAAPAAVPAVERERRAHALPAKQRSRLWSGMSYGDVDSLQNALDAFRAEEEIASEGGGSEVLVPEIGSFRKRARKPIKPSNSFLSLDNSLLGAGGAQQYKGLKEKSDENGAGKGDVISSGNAATTRPRRTRGGEGEGEQEVSQNTDSRAAEHGPEDTAAGGRGVVAEATPVDPDEALPVAQRRVRHVPRQSSAANLGARVQPADIKRMAAELDTLRQDNKRLRLQLELASGSSGAGPGGSPLGGRNVADLERRCRQLEMELRQSAEQRRTLEQKVQDLTNDLHTTRTAANQLVTKFLMEQHQQAPQHPPGPMPPALDPAAATAAPGYSSYGPGPGGFPMDRLGLAAFGSGPAGASAAAGSYLDPRSSGSFPDPRASGPGGMMDYKPKGYDSDLGREHGSKRVKMEPSNGIAELLAAAAAAREGLPGV